MDDPDGKYPVISEGSGAVVVVLLLPETSWRHVQSLTIPLIYYHLQQKHTALGYSGITTTGTRR